VAAALLAAALALSVPAAATARVVPVTASRAAARAGTQGAPPTPAQELARIAAAGKPTPPAPILAPGPLVWAAPVGIDGNPINGLACPSISLCVAVDAAGHVLSSADPTGGARAWQSADVDGSVSLPAVSCPSISICVAVDGDGNVVSTGDASTPPAAWTVARVDTSITEPSPYGGGPALLRGVSCPSVSFCVAVDSVGNVAYSGAPTGGAATWILNHIDDNSDYGCTGGGPTCQAPLMGVSCPTVALCAAVDFTGNVLLTSAPVSASTWPSQSIAGGGPQSLWMVSCPSVSFCATVDGFSGDVITWDPAAGVSLTSHRLPIDAFGIWCSSSTLCLAAGEGSNGTAELLGSTDPAAKSPTWDVTDFGDINAVSCPTESECLAADDEGEVIAGVTVASLEATMRREAIGGRIPRIGTLVHKRGYRFAFTGPLAGQLQVTWQLAGTVLATASARFAGPQERSVRLELTGAGRSLLARARRLNVTASATYETNTGTVSTQRELTLR